MSLRAIFTSFDHFMAMFVAMFGVCFGSVFMSLLGGPLHTYEARAIGAGFESLQTGQAANIGEAFQVATSFPADIMLPSAHAAELPAQPIAAETQQASLELLGGPDVDVPILTVAAIERAAPRVRRAQRISRAPAPAERLIHAETTAAPACDIPAVKRGLCEMPVPDTVAAST
jgi:hypothetical protein